MKATEHSPLETDVRKKTGAVFPVEIHARSMQYQDVPLTVVAMRDISERKKRAAAEQETAGMFKDALGGSIQALSLTLALRDPFAAGHGEGVAELAAAKEKVPDAG